MADATLRWAINLAEWQPSEQRMQQLLALLSPLEQQQVTHYVHLDDQKRSLVSRLMQRACASQVLGVPWHTVDIARTAGNRPYIANAVHRPHALNFNYNVSHEVGAHSATFEAWSDLQPTAWPPPHTGQLGGSCL